jgi:hypothetical protein
LQILLEIVADRYRPGLAAFLGKTQDKLCSILYEVPPFVIAQSLRHGRPCRSLQPARSRYPALAKRTGRQKIDGIDFPQVRSLAVAAKRKPTAKKPSAIYQFKITLLGLKPPVWRRIQVSDGTLDDLHEHIQTAMGWNNSHLHHFVIRGHRYGDPELLDDGFEDEDELRDSTQTELSVLLAKARKSTKVGYEYDFGDSWEHEVLFEECVPAEPGVRYPRCIEGARACPPEDVGGVWGYAEFLEAIHNPKHEEHVGMLEWIGGKFDPEKFSAVAATKEMRRGLPNWRDFR